MLPCGQGSETNNHYIAKTRVEAERNTSRNVVVGETHIPKIHLPSLKRFEPVKELLQFNR
jgi:hypothetical protein